MAGPAPSPRMIREKIGALKKDATSTGLIPEGLKLPCSSQKKDTQATPPTPPPATGTTGFITNNNKLRLTATTPVKTTKSLKRKLSSSHIDTEDHQPIDASSDTDSDSLAGVDETPTRDAKRQRRLPARASRSAVKSYAVDTDVFTKDGDSDDNDAALKKTPDAGAMEEESEDDFNPFKARREQEKKEAKAQRGRRSYGWLK
jgi:hypothetical protein